MTMLLGAMLSLIEEADVVVLTLTEGLGRVHANFAPGTTPRDNW